MRKFTLTLSTAIALLMFIPFTFLGQIKFTGNIGLTNHIDIPADAPLSSRYQIRFRPQLNFNNWQIGTTAMIRFKDKEFASGVLDFLTDYSNNFSAFLKYKTLLRLNVGRTTPNVKGIAICNRSVMGGQLIYQPEKWMISVFSGMNPARKDESDKAFSLSIWGGEFRYGNPNKSYIGLSFIYGNEDSTSLEVIPTRLKPMRSSNLGIYSQIKFSQWYTMNIAIGASLFTEDLGFKFTQNAPLKGFLADNAPFLDLAMEIQKRSSWGPFYRNGTSRPGLAARVDLARKSKHLTLGIHGEYYSAAYNSLAVLYQEQDYLNTTLNISIRLFENRFFISGKAGLRSNQFYQNVKTKNLELKVQSSINLRLVPNRTFSISGKYNNMEHLVFDGVGDYVEKWDTMVLILSQLSRKTHLVGLTPQVNLGKKKKHRLWASYVFNVQRSNEIQFDGINTRIKTRNQSMEGRLGYSFNSKIIGAGVDASYLYYTRQATDTLITESYTAKPWVKLSLFKRKLSVKCSFKTAVEQATEATKRRFNTRFDLRYRLTKKITFQFNATQRDFNSGDSPKRSIQLISSLNIRL